MGERTSYPPGTFCWTDLSTPDQDGAKAFYTQLFGWEATDIPIGHGLVYSTMTAGGADVAGIGPQPEQQRAGGAPPMWNSYVWVEDADAAVERAKELGGNVHAPPFDVMGAGRMAVIQDPQGAYFEVWQPARHRGAQLVNAPGALVWNELASPDLDGSSAFYGALFGWTFEPFEGSPTRYLSALNGGQANGGITELQPPASPHWLVYFGIEELEAGLATVTELGGSVIAGPIPLPMARIAVVSDPQGAVFALYAGNFDD